MSTATASALNLGKTANCKTISYHFTMGIGRLRQIATKVVKAVENLDSDATGLATAVVTTGTTTVVTTAKASELRHQKRLIDSPELDEIRSMDSKLKRFIEAQSASAGHESTRFVLAENVESIWRAMEAYRTIRRPALVAAFMVQYRELEAVDFVPLAAALGDAFVRSDYQKSDVVEAGFAFTYTIRNFGELTLTGLPSYIVEQEIAKEREQRAVAVEEFKGILRLSAAELVESLYNQVKPNVDGKKRRFSDSCVTNLLAFVSNFDKQDMANDAAMQAVVADLKAALKGVSPERLKESENLKQFVTDQLVGVKKSLSTLVTAVGRKFR